MKIYDTKKIKRYNGKYEEERVCYIWSEQEYKNSLFGRKILEKDLVNIHMSLFNAILLNQNMEIISDIEGLQSIKFYNNMIKHQLMLQDKITAMADIISKYESVISGLIEIQEDIKFRKEFAGI